MKLNKLQAGTKTTTKRRSCFSFVSVLFTLMSNCAALASLAGFVGFPRVSMKARPTTALKKGNQGRPSLILK